MARVLLFTIEMERDASDGPVETAFSFSPVLSIAGRPSALRIVDIAGDERMSSLFAFAITVVSHAPNDAEMPEVGARASVELVDRGRSRMLHGVIRSFERGDADGARPIYRLTLAPATCVLAIGADCRIFQAKRAPEIIEAVLAGAGFTSRDFRFALHRTYAAREHTA